MPGEENKNSASNAVQNDEIRKAIDSFDFPQARLLLRDALRTADGETYYLASLVALNDRQKRDFLQKALAADPFHAEAFAAIEQLNSPAPTTSALPVVPSVSIPVRSVPSAAEWSVLQQTPAMPRTISTPAYEPPIMASAAIREPIPIISDPPEPTIVLTTNDEPIAADTSAEPVSISQVAVEAVVDAPNETPEPTPPGGIVIQQLIQSAVSVPQQESPDDKNFVKGIIKQDTPLYVIPDRRGTIRAQLLAIAEVILLTRTEDLRWVNVMWLSSINKETIGWLPLSTISNGYVQGNTVNLMDLPITKYEFSDTAHLIELQILLQQEKWDLLRRNINLVLIVVGIAFCSFVAIDAAVGTQLPIDYLALVAGFALILFGLVRWWISTAEVREKWHLLDAIRRHKQASDDFAVTQQANSAALKLASEMVMALMRSRSNNQD